MIASAAPWSQSCENNKAPILEVLTTHIADARAVLEIGSGTGQHAVHFAPAFPHTQWHTSDLAANHPGILAWIAGHPSPNLHPPLLLDVLDSPWPELRVDAIFSANTAHIMPWPAVRATFEGAGRMLPPGARMLLYGPFSYGGRHTSAGNVAFDASLRAGGSGMGIRAFEDVDGLARENGFELEIDHPMPANNRTLIWHRT